MLLKQSTARTRTFLMIDSADHVTGKTGLTVTVTLSKDGAAFGAAAGSVTEIGDGWYKVALTTTDTNTLGDLAVHCTATGADPTDFADDVVSFDLADIGNRLSAVVTKTGAVVSDSANASDRFKANLTEVTDDHYKYAWIKITSGSLKEQVRQCTAYDGTTKTVYFTGNPFAGTPAPGDAIEIVND